MKHISSQLLLSAVVVLLISGCATKGSRWKDANSINTIAAYREFLSRYPKGELADEARSKIESLELQKAKDTNTIRGYESFLRRYPKGELADEARASLQSLQEQIRQVREAAKSAFRHPKQAKVEVKSVHQYPSKPTFAIKAVLLQSNSANEDLVHQPYYDSHKGLTVLVKKRCARILKSLAKGSKLPDASEIAIWGCLSGGKEGFGPAIYNISITIDEIKKHDWSSIEEKKIMELWKVNRNRIRSLVLQATRRPPTLPELQKMLKN
jgi:hypothetical protein